MSYCPMMTLTLLKGRNDGDLKSCLASFLDGDTGLHSYELLVGDQGMSPQEVKTVEEFGGGTIPVPEDRSEARNLLISKSTRSHIVHIEPWERLVGGTLQAVDTSSNERYAFQIVRGDVVTRETRVCYLWDDPIRYCNPVFETHGQTGGEIVATVTSEPPPINMVALKKWVSTNPTCPKARYFLAVGYLSTGNFGKFKTEANQYLFMENSPESAMPITMTRYYMALEALSRKDANETVKMAVACLTVMPLMAEFWCLVGDVHYHLLQSYDRAIFFYENATILGARRLADDGWPLQISKYGDYPNQMIASCRAILSGSRHKVSPQTQRPTR